MKTTDFQLVTILAEPELATRLVDEIRRLGARGYSLVEGTQLPVDVADSNTVDGTLARIPDGSDTDDAATDWSFTTTPTPGAANVKTP